MTNTLRLITISFILTLAGYYANGQPTLSGVKYINSTTAMAVGSAGTILRSNDGGITWATQPSGTSTYLFALAFPSSSTGTVVGGDPVSGTQTVVHTGNSGSSWASQLTGTALPMIGVGFADANNGFAVGYGGHLVHTNDGGATWQNIVTGVLSTLDNVAYIDANTATVVGDLGVIMRTTNAGATWTQQSGAGGNDIYGVSFTSLTTGTCVGVNGTILRTTNGGSTWVRQTSGITGYLNAVCFVDDNNGWAVGNGGTILHTNNGGASWTSQSLAIANWSDVSFIDANNGLVVGDHGTTIIRTANGGASWTQQTVGGTPPPPPPPPAAPVLASPANGSTNQSVAPTLSWNASSGATSYHLQVSTSSTFSPVVVDQNGLTATSSPVSGLANGTTYYWHVSASNSGGTSAYSGAYSFATGAVTGQPACSVNPASYNFGGVALGSSATTTVTVTNSGTATLTISSIQSTGSNFTVGASNATLAPGASQTVSITFTPTTKNATVSASINFVSNAPSSPSVAVTGKTGRSGKAITEAAGAEVGSIPVEYSVSQNYPNPFNPTTTISYALPEPSVVRLSVYNALGQEVATLVNGQVGAGSQSVAWNASNRTGSALPSGIYFYRVQATSVSSGKEFSETKRMMLMK
jgi:hypothetical protein